MKNLILSIIFIIIVLFVLVGIYISKPKIELKKDLKYEINTNINLYSLIKNIKFGEIITKDKLIDTSKLGKNTIYLEINNIYKHKIKTNVVYYIEDTIPPQIDVNEIYETKIEEKFDLESQIKTKDNSNNQVKIYLEGTYDLKKEGEYTIKIIAEDSSHNKSEKNTIVKVKPNKTSNESDKNNNTIVEFTTSKGYNGKTINGVTYIDNILIANKTYSLPSSYGSKLENKVLDAFNKMKADALTLGLNLYISSGFRSYTTQKKLYNNYVIRDGIEKADTYSARPGHSEHQSGLAFDINIINDTFADTEEAKWVNANCYKYGFVIRYPKGKENITGYKYEPWHLRYLNNELALKLYNNGDWLTLEEYFGITSEYKE